MTGSVITLLSMYGFAYRATASKYCSAAQHRILRMGCDGILTLPLIIHTSSPKARRHQHAKIVLFSQNHPLEKLCLLRWLAKNEEDGAIRRRLQSTGASNGSSTTSYRVTTYTSDIKGAGTDAGVWIELVGEKDGIVTQVSDQGTLSQPQKMQQAQVCGIMILGNPVLFYE